MESKHITGSVVFRDLRTCNFEALVENKIHGSLVNLSQVKCMCYTVVVDFVLCCEKLFSTLVFSFKDILACMLCMQCIPIFLLFKLLLFLWIKQMNTVMYRIVRTIVSICCHS